MSAGSDGIVCLCGALRWVRWVGVVSPRVSSRRFTGERNARLSLIQCGRRSIHQIGPRHCILSAVTAVPGLPLATLRTWVGLLGALGRSTMKTMQRLGPRALWAAACVPAMLPRPLSCHSFAVRLSFALAHRTHLLLSGLSASQCKQLLSRAP